MSTVAYVAYIDESGDTGIEAVRPIDAGGATEWLVLACLLIRIESDPKALGWVKEIQSKFRNVQSPYLHYADLLGAKKAVACELLATKPCAMFVIMSNKKNIRGYKNPRLDSGNKAWIYWFLSRLLLENVTDFCEQRTPASERGKQKLRIIFSRRGGLKYIDFENYLRKLERQSRAGMLVLDQGDLCWSVIDYEEIFVLDHKQRAGLQLADIVSGAFFQSVERNRPADCDPTYAKLLKPRLASNRHHHVIGYGIKTMPLLHEMGLTKEQREIFEYYGYIGSGWQAPGP